jgi:hypothetical protein
LASDVSKNDWKQAQLEMLRDLDRNKIEMGSY